MLGRGFPLEGFVFIYFLVYLPNIVVTKLITSIPHLGLGRPLTGLETLPATLIISTIITYLFIWLSGWHRDANAVQIAGRRIPVPTRYTLLSGFGTALVLFTVPLSFTFQGVSIPFIQLLMRGDILLIAPLVDLMFGRKVRWWSWAALVLVLCALVITVGDRGGLNLPPLAILTILLYTAGYFVRLAVMTKVSKGHGQASIRKYFVEEKVIAMPLSVLVLALLSASGIGSQAGELEFGFLGVWTDPVLMPLIAIAVTMTAVAVLSIIILLDPRENSYCVPMERAASLLAGIMAALLLAWFWGLPSPRPAELLGALILIAAVVLLSLAPRLSRRVDQARAETV
jgi:drug/metabolite transporter (DMT)-like permease